MFGSGLGSVDEAALVAEIEACTRAEAATAARRLAATAELAARANEPDAERERWVIDTWTCAAAEVAAAMGISQRGASREMSIALALRERLPKVAAEFSAGRISAKLIATITWRTHLVLADDVVAQVDAAVAERAVAWGALSAEKLELAIDAVVETYDPDARRRFYVAARGRDVRLGKPDDATGTASLWGRLSVTDAAVLEHRLAEMTSDLCPADPRTQGERRSEALGAIAAGADRLKCQCSSPQCPSAGQEDPRARAFVIHALTDAVSGPAAQEPDAEESAPKPAARSKSSAALIVGGGVIPTPLLAELINNGATVQTAYRPDGVAPETRYRPSRRCERFVRTRDMTCRFPGCNRRAEYCDLDHTVPYPGGPTHPSNIKCLCRFHHLLKTFCDWQDEQYPDGTILWTAPSGRTYRSYPLSWVYFPHWDTTTADLPPPADGPPPSAVRTLKMPRRRRTRAAEVTARINAERARNRSARTL